MSFQVGIDSLGGTVFFSGGTLYPSANYGGKRAKKKKRSKMGCCKIQNARMAIYGTWINKSGMQNTEQIIQNGKTLNSISSTGKTAKHGTQ